MAWASLVGSLSPDIGIDLGTVSTPVLECGRGVTMFEPSFVAYDRGKGLVAAVGARAKAMFERVPERIEVVRPIREGVIVDYAAAEVMMRHLLRRTVSKGLLGPRIMVGVPVGASDVECRAVSEITRTAGARMVYVVPQPLAAAVGAGLPVLESRGSMILDIGGGTAQAAVISMGGVIVSDCVRLGGDAMDESIQRYLCRERGLLVGLTSAEELKVSASSAIECEQPLEAEVRGRDFQTGLPRKLMINSNDLCPALKGVLYEIGTLVMRVLENTPPALASDIMENGVALTGGGALLRGLDEYLRTLTGVPAYVVAEPLVSAALGTEILFHDPRLMRTLLSSGVGAGSE